MIDWWGPVIYEYYAGTEGNGFVQLNSEEWLAHKGSVGKPLGCEVIICDDEGNELPVGEPGTIYLAAVASSSTTKTTRRRPVAHPKGWTTLGDVGYLDEEGFCTSPTASTS